MKTTTELHPKFVMDTAGHQTAVILPIEEYYGLLEDLDDLAVVAERTNEPAIPHEQVVRELKSDGYLSD